MAPYISIPGARVNSFVCPGPGTPIWLGYPQTGARARRYCFQGKPTTTSYQTPAYVYNVPYLDRPRYGSKARMISWKQKQNRAVIVHQMGILDMPEELNVLCVESASVELWILKGLCVDSW